MILEVVIVYCVWIFLVFVVFKFEVFGFFLLSVLLIVVWGFWVGGNSCFRRWLIYVILFDWFFKESFNWFLIWVKSVFIVWSVIGEVMWDVNCLKDIVFIDFLFSLYVE